MAKQDEFTVISTINRFHIALRSQYRVVTEKLNYPSAAAKIKQMMDLCIQVEGELSKSNGLSTAQPAMVSSNLSPTINSSVFNAAKQQYTIAINDKRNVNILNMFIESWSKLLVEEQNELYAFCCEISESNPPWGFEPISE